MSKNSDSQNMDRRYLLSVLIIDLIGNPCQSSFSCVVKRPNSKRLRDSEVGEVGSYHLPYPVRLPFRL